MQKLRNSLGVILALVAVQVFAQSSIIRGEVSAGVYENIGSSSARLQVSTGTFGTAIDGSANPTVGGVAGYNYIYNGSTWDRWRSGNALGAAKVTTAGLDPCQSTETIKLSAAVNISTAATTAIVAPVGGQIVYVCAFSMTISQVVTTANTIKFVRGTGATCGTGTNDLTGAFGTGGVTAAAPITVSMGFGGTLFKGATSDGVCATTTIGGSGAFVGVVTYIQQ